MRSLLFLPLWLGACGASTESICEDACNGWDSCYQDPYDSENGRYCDGYTYDICMDECQSDGDWSRSYASCVTSQATCCDITDECG